MPDEPGIRAEAEVRLWGETVGALVELDSGRIIFEYADGFRRSGLEISPLHLPTSLMGPVTFERLSRKPAFEGLPGVLADALPDAFGRRVIRAYYAARGEPETALSPVQRLLYVGERALGALTFHPATDIPPREAELRPLEIARLAHDARNLVLGRAEVAVPEIYRIGSSAGGQRPKAIVHHDPATGILRSGGGAPEPGEVPCILKFDGVGEGNDDLGDPQPYNRVEAAYADMARAAGLDMCTVNLLEIDGYAHLLIPRFDIVDGRRLHQHTFGGIIHVDYNDPGASSYEEYFRTIQRLGMAYDALAEGFRRMAFNVLARNQDDHVKNLSFHMDPSGEWSMTPAYDVTFAVGSGWTRAHQMRVRDKTSGIRIDDMLAVAREFGVKRAGLHIERIQAAVGDWEGFADARGVPAPVRDRIRTAIDEAKH